MGKDRVTINERKLRFIHEAHEYRAIRTFQVRQIDPILTKLFGRPMLGMGLINATPLFESDIESALKNHLIVSCVGAIEYYLRQFVRKIIDENSIDVSNFLKGNFEEKLREANLRRKKQLTRGEFFSAQFDFTQPSVISAVLSRLLQLDFFETVKRLDDDPDSFRYYKGARSLHKNWKTFIKMFDWRQQIVHEMRWANLTKTQLRDLSHNTMMFIDNTSIFYSYYDGRLTQYTNHERELWKRVIDEQKRLYKEHKQRTSPLHDSI